MQTRYPLLVCGSSCIGGVRERDIFRIARLRRISSSPLRRRVKNQGWQPRAAHSFSGQKMSSPLRIGRTAISRGFEAFLSTEIVDKAGPVDTVLFM
jgi:hypothetical protein